MEIAVDPRTGREVMTLESFSVVQQIEFARIAALPKPPSKWKDYGLVQLPSRAYYEWFAERGRNPDGRRPETPAWMKELVLCRDRGVCGICDQPIGPDDVLHFDHIFPVAHGGKTEPSNLQPAHGPCNIKKGATV